jgi:hypothetical protein
MNELSSMLRGATYVYIRPTFELGDYTVTSTIDDAEACQLRCGLPDRPSELLSWDYGSVEEAVEAALTVKAENPFLRVFYDGQEVRHEFDSIATFQAPFVPDWYPTPADLQHALSSSF